MLTGGVSSASQGQPTTQSHRDDRLFSEDVTTESSSEYSSFAVEMDDVAEDTQSVSSDMSTASSIGRQAAAKATLIPEEVIRHMFDYLTPSNVFNAAGVCRAWRHAIMNPRSRECGRWWELLYKKHWQHTVPMKGRGVSSCSYWLEMFKAKLSITRRLKNGNPRNFTRCQFNYNFFERHTERKGISCLELVTPPHRSSVAPMHIEGNRGDYSNENDEEEEEEYDYILSSSFDRPEVIVWRKPTDHNHRTHTNKDNNNNNSRDMSSSGQQQQPGSADFDNDDSDDVHDDDDDDDMEIDTDDGPKNRWQVHKVLKGHTFAITCIKFIGYSNSPLWNNNCNCNCNCNNNNNNNRNNKNKQRRAICVTSSCDNTIRVWDLISGECLRILEGHRDWVKNVIVLENYHRSRANIGRGADNNNDYDDYDDDYSPEFNMNIASCAKDRKVIVWNIIWGTAVMSLDHERSVWCMDFMSDGYETDDRSSRTTTLQRSFSSSPSNKEVGFNNNLLFAGCEDGTLKVWHLPTGSCVASLRHHNDLISCLQYVRGTNRLVTASYDRSINVYSIGRIAATPTATPTATPINIGRSTIITFHNNNNNNSSSSNETATDRDPDDDNNNGNINLLYTLSGAHNHPICSLSCSPTTIVSCCISGWILAWNLKTGAYIQSFVCPKRFCLNQNLPLPMQLYSVQYKDGFILSNIDVHHSGNGLVMWSENSIVPIAMNTSLSYSTAPATVFCMDGHKIASGAKNEKVLKVWEF